MSGIYVHVPFCKSKCTYCDFASYPREIDKAELYFGCVYRELEARANRHKGLKIDTVYFGGGTPSIVDAKYIAGAIKLIKQKYFLTDDAEITVELNPGTVDKQKIEVYKRAGVNRFSLGLQSADNKMLAKLNRVHTVADYKYAAKLLKGQNFNADALIGLFDQTEDDLKNTLDVIIDSGASHISMYALKAEDGTPIYSAYLNGELPDDDRVAELYAVGVDYMRNRGFFRYEVSNFAKEGKQSRHNKNYWERGEYIGVGVSASGHVDNVRYTNTYSVDEYIKCILSGHFAEISAEKIEGEEIKSEYIMLRLRTEDGIDREAYKRLFNKDFVEEFAGEIKSQKEFLDITERAVRVKPEYTYVQNSIIITFMK